MKNKFYVLFFKSICFIYYRWVQGHCPCWCSRKYPSDPLRYPWARAVKEEQQFWSLVIFPCLVLSAVPTVVLGTQASESSIPRNFIASVAWHEFQMGALFFLFCQVVERIFLCVSWFVLWTFLLMCGYFKQSLQILNMKVTSGLCSMLLWAANANRVLYFNKALLDCHSNESSLPSQLS